jgi:lipopolysaccharide/colanic/teichoic acid biosynthesis glycosyltransferase
MTFLEPGLAYCRGRRKRVFDLCAVSAALVTLAPLFGLLAGLVLLCMGRPILFVQERVGLDGRTFPLLKFRTMRPDGGGLPITGRGDRRITALGSVLRATKLDELPQLINVLRGEMSIVGPRPELPRYTAGYAPAHRRVLMTRPGLTDPATLLFRQEEQLLGDVPEEKRERYYVDTILPRKLDLNVEYLVRAGLLYDLGLIARTFGAIVAPRRP